MNVHSPNKTAECNLQIYGYDILQPALYVCDSINCGTTTRLISHLWPKKPLSKKKNPLCFPSVASQKLVLNLTKLGNQTSYEFRGREILNQGRVKKPSNSIIFPFHTNTNFSNQREIV